MDPRVLARLIGEMTAEQSTRVDVEADVVKDIILRACDALRDETVDRVSAKLIDETWQRDDKERVEVQTANQAARKVVGQGLG